MLALNLLIQVNLDCKYCFGTGQGIISNPPKIIRTIDDLKMGTVNLNLYPGNVRIVNCQCVVFAPLWNSNLVH